MPGGLTLTQIALDPFVQTGLLALVGALVVRLLRRTYPARRLIVQVTFFLALTGLLAYHGIVPYEVAPADTPVFERIFVALSKIVWWVNAAWLAASFARAFLTFEQQPREGRLIQDIVVGIVYLGATLSVVAYVFSAPVGTLIATSGVLAVILGLALQSTLSDLFSGLALNISRPYMVGDWIVLSDDNIEGRVVETNWRATHLLNGTNDLVVLPNSGLAKSRFTNLSSPNRSHGVTLNVRLAPTMAPSALAEVMNTVLMSSNSIATTPPPAVWIKSLDAQAIEFTLSFRVKDFAAASTAKHEVYDLIYRHTRASGIALAGPPGAAAAPALQPAAAPASTTPRTLTLRLLDATPLFVSLTEEEKETLARSMTRRTYRKNEVVVEEGAKLNALMVIRNGVVVVSRNEDGHDVELSRLAPGDYFGDGGVFTDTEEKGTVRALTAVTIYEIAQAGLAQLLRQRPSIADEIGMTLTRRDKLGQAPTGNVGDEIDEGAASRLIARIRQLFEVRV
jgi:small-conductance mechanosensitive channel/CRP-like cAMP-binding protein